MHSLFRKTLPLVFPALIAFAGCNAKPAGNPELAAKYRKQLTLAEEPDGAETVLDVRSRLLGEEAPNVLAMLEEEHDHAAHDHGDHEHAEVEHADHDHAGEAAGADDHAADEHAEGEHADHDHEAHEDHDAGEAVAATDEHAAEEHDHEHADHDHGDHDHAGHDHADHDHADHDGKSEEVVLVGLVGGVPNPFKQGTPDFPFTKGQAMFFLADPEAVAELEEHGHQHAPGEECAFCLANAADAAQLIAAVTFMDENGKVLAVDARDLFDLKSKDAVVIKGTAKMAPGSEFLQVQATGLYVRR